jgi:hypothetical protein
MGVDLGQPEAALCDVKVIAEEHALDASGIVPRDGRHRPGHLRDRPAARRPTRSPAPRSPCVPGVRETRRKGTHGEQVRTALLYQIEQSGLAQLGRQGKTQRRMVQADAGTFAVPHRHRSAVGRCRTSRVSRAGRRSICRAGNYIGCGASSCYFGVDGACHNWLPGQ